VARAARTPGDPAGLIQAVAATATSSASAATTTALIRP
jgi:hypothetical protein